MENKKIDENEKRGIVTEDYISPYSKPLFLKKGEQIIIEDRKSEWPGWIWCIGEAGQSMWTPENYLDRSGGHGTMLRDYIATELTVKKGESLKIISEEASWFWCENAAGNLGWVPIEKIQVSHMG